jgi:cytochrome c oxidase cbb3-type subunit 3
MKTSLNWWTIFMVMPAALGVASGQTAGHQFDAADRAAGEKIFRGHCASCHGLKGAGGSGPNLTSGVFYHGSTDADLYRNISEGIPGTAMPDQFFSSAQIWQIVAYVREISSAPVGPQLMGDARRGAQLFRNKGCLECHLVKGEGNVKGPDLSLIGSQRSPAYLQESIANPGAVVAPEYWVAKIVTKDGRNRAGFILNQDSYAVQLLDFDGGLQTVERSDFKDFGVDRGSIMPSYKEKLSEAELNDVVAFLASLQRPREARK